MSACTPYKQNKLIVIDQETDFIVLCIRNDTRNVQREKIQPKQKTIVPFMWKTYEIKLIKVDVPNLKLNRLSSQNDNELGRYHSEL